MSASPFAINSPTRWSESSINKYAEKFMRNIRLAPSTNTVDLFTNPNQRKRMRSASFAAELIGSLPLCLLLEGKFSGNDFGNDQL